MNSLTFPSSNAQTALECLRSLGDGPELETALQACVPGIAAALDRTRRPERVLALFKRLAERLDEPAMLLHRLAEFPQLGHVLVVLFAGSHFLSEILLRHPEYLLRLHDLGDLGQALTPEALMERVEAALEPWETIEGRLDALRRCQRWHMLRIGVCDLLGLLDLPTVTGQLSLLADTMIRICLSLAEQQTGDKRGHLVVIALGKLGGGELNYSSDIDLLLVAREEPQSYVRLGAALIDGLSRITGEGFLYRVDMRLRPWGRVGPLVSSYEGFLRYLAREARLWEKQALLKARPVAGDVHLGRELLEAAMPLMLNVQPDFVRRDVLAMKRRIERAVQGRAAVEDARGADVKRGVGSIRDVEFVTQYLQLLHGRENPQVLNSNTLRALEALAKRGLLAERDARILIDGYTFLRPVEHFLQIIHYRQTHALPERPEELEALARRLGFGASGRAGAELLERYRQHSAAIRSVYRRIIEKGPQGMQANSSPPTADVERHVSRMAPSYLEAFTSEEVRLHADLVGRLSQDVLVQVEGQPLGD
ncbi:MAG: glutamine synthetase adenylyltransferase, partial [Chloroflexi bacterium]|nr:glutamine synthetase adenylyltransferase [Chloroflexota bacterium]